MKLKLLIGFALLAVVTACQAQTNTPPVAALPDSTAADVAKVFSDFGIHVSLGGITIALAILIPLFKALCGYARKVIPKTAQVNMLGILLAHGAGVDSPTLKSLSAEIPPAIIPPVQPQPAAAAAQPKQP